MNVYDFDNTIYDGESAFDLFLEYIKVNPKLIKMMPTVLKTLARYKLGKVTVEQFISDYAPVVKKYYCEYEHWDEFTKKFWDEHMHKIKPFYKELHRDDDILVTASPDITMKVIAERLGIKNIVCSVIDRETGEIKRMCMREKKSVYFRESFPDAVIDNFYTDSIVNDGFFAREAANVFIVKGNGITRYK